MFNKEPQKINPNDSGIDFSKSEKIGKYFKNEKTNLYSEITSGPVVGDELILYVDTKRLKNLIELQQEKLLIDIEKNTKIKLKKLNIQVDNNQQ
ncbi:hypothetical protein OA077_00045 [Acidimicrobiaceae bacterium]|nr:hypothetical protein [Acidimicrobiaceae bacterium]